MGDVGIHPILLEIIKGAIRSSQSEMAALLDRTAMSPFIREKKDYFIGVFDAGGRLVHSAGLPLMGDVIKPVLDRYALDSIQEGDIFWYNDCYGSGGAVSHTPDQVIITPIFSNGKIRAFSLTWAHFNDIGGLRPGTLSPDAENIFQEGTMVPPIRLFSAGRQNDDAVAIFAANSRFPEMVRGDLRALVAAVRLGKRRLEELFAQYGDEIILKAFAESERQTAETVRQRLAELLPTGRYVFTDRVDTDGHGNGPFAIRFELERSADGSMTLDATGSDDQAPGPINFLMSKSVPAMTLGLRAGRDDPTLLINQGHIETMREVKLREGSILQPRFPAPLGLRGTTFVKVQQAMMGLVNTATGGAGLAANNAYSIYFMSGLDESGAEFLLSDGLAVGYGARPSADGVDAIYFVGQENYPVEFIELSYPVDITAYGLHIDSGGPGRFRGGCGIVREIRPRVDSTRVSVRIEGTLNPPWGTAGGQAGRAGSIRVNPGSPGENTLPPIKDGVILNKGDVLRIQTGGGGGWGNPFDRDPALVAEDVADAMVSIAGALKDYGVVVDAATFEVDEAATTMHRAENRPDERLFHNGTYREAMA